MPSLHLDSTHGRTKRAWNACVAFGQYTRSDDIGHGMPLCLLDNTHEQKKSIIACRHTPSITHTVGRLSREMSSKTLDNTHGRMTSNMASYQGRWTAHMVVQRRPWNIITALRKYTGSDEVGSGMPSWTLDNTHGQTMSGMACSLCQWTSHTVR